MEAENYVGPDCIIDEGSAGPDFCSAVKKSLGEGQNLSFRCPAQESSGIKPQVVRAEIRDGIRGRTDKGDEGPEGLQFRSEKFGSEKSHVAFSDRVGVGNLIPSLFHPGPITSDMARIDRDS